MAYSLAFGKNLETCILKRSVGRRVQNTVVLMNSSRMSQTSILPLPTILRALDSIAQTFFLIFDMNARKAPKHLLATAFMQLASATQ
jgi:hypothetical protein